MEQNFVLREKSWVSFQLVQFPNANSPLIPQIAIAGITDILFLPLQEAHQLVGQAKRRAAKIYS